MRKVFVTILLALCSNLLFAEYAIINNIVYSLNLNTLEAVVLNFQPKESTVTIPSSITYKGDKYTVKAISRYDFDWTRSDSYNAAENAYDEAGNWFFGDATLSRAAANQTYNAAEKKRANEAAFRYDYETARANIITLNLPNSLVYIEKYAFDGMTRLKSLVIPASVKQLPPRGLSVFYEHMSRLESITILGLPSYEFFDETWLDITSKDDDGNYNYVNCLKSKFDVDYCPNLKTFSVPEFEKRLSVLQEAEKVNDKIEDQTDNFNAELYRLSQSKELKIPTPALKAEACMDKLTIEAAYNQVMGFLNSIQGNYKAYINLHDSLNSQLVKHPYYDGSKLSYETLELDYNEPMTSNIKSQFAAMRERMMNSYLDFVNGGMERNLLEKNTDKYIKVYKGLHPEKKDEIDKIFKDYRCETLNQQYAYFRQYVQAGFVSATTCRKKQWNEYRTLYDSEEEFNGSYDKATTAGLFSREISLRQSSWNNLEAMKKYVPAHVKDIKLSNMNKKPNDATATIIKYLDGFKQDYYYSKAVSYLIETIPSLNKEYEKNGQFFTSEVKFLDAYTSDAYSQLLKESKKK